MGEKTDRGLGGVDGGAEGLEGGEGDGWVAGWRVAGLVPECLSA